MNRTSSQNSPVFHQGAQRHALPPLSPLINGGSSNCFADAFTMLLAPLVCSCFLTATTLSAQDKPKPDPASKPIAGQPPAIPNAAKADDVDVPPPEPDDSEEFKQLPVLEQKPIPSLERLLKGPPVDWLVLVRANKVIEVEPVSPRPNTLQKVEEHIRKVIDPPLPKVVGTDDSARNEEKAKRREAYKLNVVLLKNDQDDGEYKIHVRTIRQVIHYEDLMLKRIDLLLDEERNDDCFELLTALQQRAPDWPGIGERRDRLKFVEAVVKHRKQLYEQALAQFEQVFAKSPAYPNLDRQLGTTIDALIQENVGQGKFRDARHFLVRLKRCYPNHLVAERWTNDLVAMATKELQLAAAAEQQGHAVEAVDHAERATRIWPDGSDVGDGYRKIFQRHQRLNVGTLDLAAGDSSTPVATERERRLLQSTIFEPGHMTDRLVRYHTRFIQDWEPTDLGRSIVFRLKRQSAPWEGPEFVTAGPLVAEIAARLNPAHEGYDERFANYVSSVRSLSPFELSVDFRHAPLRPETLFQFAVPLAGAPTTPSPETVSTARQRFVRASVSPDRVSYLRALPQPSVGKELYLAEIVERRYSSSETLWQGWLRGEFSVMPQVPLWDLEKASKLPDSTLFEYALPQTHIIQFHPRNHALRNGSLRRALVYATDRKKILNDVVLQNKAASRGRLTSGPFAWKQSAYNPLIEPHRFDTRLAYSMLLAAKKELGELPKLRLGVSSDLVAKAAAKELVKQWETVGVPVELVEVGPQIPFDATRDPAPWDMLYRTVQLTEPATDLWPCLTLDTHAKVESLAHLPDWLRHDLIAVDEAGDWSSAESLLRRLHRDLWSEVHLIPLWEVSEFMLTRKHLRGLPARPMFPYQDVEHWQVQPWFVKDVP